MALLFLKVPWYSCHKDFITGSFLLRNPQWCYWPSSLLLLSSPTCSCLVHLSFLLFLPYSLHLVQLTKEICPLLNFASDPLKNASECIMLNQRACFPVLLLLAWCRPVWAELCLPPVPMLRSLSSAPQKVTAEPSYLLVLHLWIQPILLQNYSEKEKFQKVPRNQIRIFSIGNYLQSIYTVLTTTDIEFALYLVLQIIYRWFKIYRRTCIGYMQILCHFV